MMSNEISLGYLVPSDDTARLTNHAFRIGVFDVDPSSDELPPWDYASPVTAAFEVQVDRERLFRESGFVSESGAIADDVDVSIHLTSFCTRTKQREGSARQTLTDGTNELTLTVPGPILGGTLRVKAEIALIRTSSSVANPLAPSMMGTKLWESESVDLVLEGAGARFTMVPVDFATTQTQPVSAQWLVQVSTDLTLPASAGIRVLVNVSNPITKKMLENPRSAESKRWFSAMEIELVTQMLLHAAFMTDPADHEGDPEEGSLGESIGNLLNVVFPNTPPQEIGASIPLIFAQAQAFVTKKRSK